MGAKLLMLRYNAKCKDKKQTIVTIIYKNRENKGT